MKTLTEEDLKFYTNIRFLHGGNDLHGADCFGIIKLVNKREYGFDIGSYERTMPQLACRSIDAFFKQIVADELWIPIEQPYTGCTVVTSNTKINDNYLADHVGIYIEPDKILSTNMAMGFSKIVPIGQEQILGFYEFNINQKD